MKQRLKRFYQEHVISELQQKFCYQNVHQIPQIDKIILNRGLGATAQNTEMLQSSLIELTKIATQRVVITRAQKAVASFKIREKMPVGVKVTLRGERIYAFLDRLMNLALPRIRDFQGVSLYSFDGRGNYSLGLEEQLMFPEIQYDQVENLQGIDLSIVTTANINGDGCYLLKQLGMPFRERTEQVSYSLLQGRSSCIMS